MLRCHRHTPRRAFGSINTKRFLGWADTAVLLCLTVTSHQVRRAFRMDGLRRLPPPPKNRPTSKRGRSIEQAMASACVRTAGCETDCVFFAHRLCPAENPKVLAFQHDLGSLSAATIVLPQFFSRANFGGDHSGVLIVMHFNDNDDCTSGCLDLDDVSAPIATFGI